VAWSESIALQEESYELAKEGDADQSSRNQSCYSVHPIDFQSRKASADG
jgi:hypothetical protein